ncbi:MAG TPA: hypothetical protein VKT77_19615, partial [Chthonomonadaceae bacterium]|nr:hypothetical protein [Chthonomonadaceae bacterium]
LLGQRTFGADAPAAIDLAERVTALAALPRRIAAAADDADETSALIEALTPLLPLLGMRYAGALPDIPERWGEAFLEARKPLARWLEEALDIRVIAPARADRFDAATMEAAETRRTVHAAENDTVMRVDRVGLARRGEALVRAIVVRYAAEGAAQS